MAANSDNIKSCDIAIIGAGAAGLATAIFAAERSEARIVLLDGAKRIGAKILVAGGGRCNVTHEVVTHEDYNGPRNVVRNVLRSFDEKAAVEWFASMGVELKQEPTGKLFPTTDDAHTVLDALLGRARELGVSIRPEHRVSAVVRDGNGFSITHSRGTLRAGRLVMATGGRSLPKSGSDGFGWSLVRKLGHTVTPTHAALAPLVLDDTFFHASVSGLSQETELSTYANGKRIDVRCGSMLWTHFGISGPVAMDASRHWVIAQAEDREPRLVANLLPGETFESTERWLMESAEEAPHRTALKCIASRVAGRLADALLAVAGVSGDTKLTHLRREDRRAIVHSLTALELPVVRDRGWNYAEVTAGGVPMGEVNAKTMQSRVCDGLHLVGEILDVDGRIGGFNFQWAWATGHICGRALGNR